MVDKIISPPTAQGQIDKINEIIDNLGSSGTSYTATCPAITPVDGVATWAITHNLGSQAVVTALYSSNNKIEHNTLITSNNALTVTFKASSAVSAGDYKIVVLASGGSSGGGSGANVDLSNISDTAKITIAHSAIPSNTYEDLTLGATGTEYTMPADGWLIFAKRADYSSPYGQYGALYNVTTGLFIEQTAAFKNNHVSILMPVKKNDVINIGYNLAGTTSSFRFYYAVGSESEAS